MVSWITTKQLLLHQDPELLHTKNQERDVLGLPTGSMDTRWVPQCITTDVKTFTSSATASERIVDTLEFFPHNYQMPQLSSTDRLLMAAKDMTDALQNTHPEVPFACVGDATISALADLATIFKLKLRPTPSPTPRAVPPTVFQHQCHAEPSHQILNSPLPLSRKTRSHTTIHTQDIPNVPLSPRVVTPRTLGPSPPRVPTRSWRLSPRNLSQDDFCGTGTANMAIALGDNHWSRQHQANAVIHPVTGKEMEYLALMKDPLLQPLWTRGFGNECGRLFQGIRDIPGTDTCFFIKLTNIPTDRKITYGKIVCHYKPHKKENERVRLTVGGDRLDYSGDVATSTADITTFKILINSTLSTEDAAMMMMDIKNYYLGNLLPRFEYMKMLLSRFPEEIVQKYNLNALAVDGNSKRHVRFEASGTPRQPITTNTFSTIQILPRTAHPGTLVT
jgi:hypothetical protein